MKQEHFLIISSFNLTFYITNKNYIIILTMSIFQPVGKKKLTNVSVVRYKYKGKRFELACYQNKIMNWRSNVYLLYNSYKFYIREKDLNEVLQAMTIYTNVSKGTLASQDDLFDAFKTDDVTAIAKLVLLLLNI